MNSTAEEPARGENGQLRYRGLLQAGGSFMGFAGITLAGTFLGGILAIINEALIARFLGPRTYGLYAIGFMLGRIGSIVAAFGMPVTVLYYLPVHLNRGDRERALGSIISGVLPPLVGGAVLAVLLQLLAEWFALSVFGEPRAVPFIRVLALLVPLIALTEVFGHIARGFGYALPYVVVRNLAPPLAYLGLILYLRWVEGRPIALAYALVGSYLAGALIGLGVIARLSVTRIGLVRPRLALHETYAYALPVVLNAIVSLALFWTDLFQLGIFTDAVTVGIYRACMQIVITFDIIWTAYTAAVGPIFPVLLSERRHQQLRDTYLAAMHLATLLATPIVLLVVCNASDLLGVLGPHFRVGALAVSILAVGNFVKIAVGVAAVLLILGGRQRLEAVNAVTAATFNIALNYFLIPRLGLVGAAIATTTSLLILSGMRLWQVARSFPMAALDPGIFRIIPIALPAVLALHFAAATLGFGPGTGNLGLLARLLLEGGVLALAIWRFCLSDHERATIRALLRRDRPAAGLTAP